MNRQSIILTITALTSTLFYQQDMGINQVLISLILIIMLYYLFPDRFSDHRVINLTILHLFSGSIAFFYPSSLVNLSSIMSFFILLGAILNPNTSVYIQILNGFYSTIASKIVLKYQKKQLMTRNHAQENPTYQYWFKQIGIPLLLTTIFITLYSYANPSFYNIIKKIDLRFINIQWIMFNSLCFYIIYNISNPIIASSLTDMDLHTGNILIPNKIKPQSILQLKEENKLGFTLLLMLNILILFYIIVDISFLSNTSSSIASELSKSVHEGIFALILSIILAISIILYFFRGNLNFFKDNVQLKKLSFLWIILNILLIITTGLKNYTYITEFGFTYKRIGVFVYLLLSIIGLFTTYSKVYFSYNLWYLIRQNTEIAFFILLVSTIVNWDSFITNYNIIYTEDTDIDYLIHLSNNNTMQLQQFTIAYPHLFSNSDKFKINKKHKLYLSKLDKNSWQEYVYDNYKYSTY